MKKGMKRLILHRETLRNLSALMAVVGGDTNTSCACEQATGCDCASQDPACTLPGSAAVGTCACTDTCLSNCRC